MAVETNRYASQKFARMRASGRLRETSHGSKWIDVTTERMKAFIALVMVMGVARLLSRTVVEARKQIITRF